MNSIPWVPWPISHWLRVRFWCLKFYKALHDLFLWPLCLIPFHSPPSNALNSSHPGPVSCSITPGMFFGASPQGLLITEHFPGPRYTPLSPSVSFSRTLITTWHKIFPCDNALPLAPLLCASLLEEYYFTFFLQLFLYTKNYALRTKRIYFDKIF